MKLVLLGPPGAGKGTIATKAKDYFNIVHISTGDLFRSNINNKTELGLMVKELIASGSLVPDSVTVRMVQERIEQSDCKNGFILDGFPRTVDQAEALAKITDLNAVVNFEISDKDVIERLSGRRMCPSTGRIYHTIFNPPQKEGVDDETGEPLIQREDDKIESINNRLKIYKEKTKPLKEYYGEKGLLVNLETSNLMTSEKVFENFLSALSMYSKKFLEENN